MRVDWEVRKPGNNQRLKKAVRLVALLCLATVRVRATETETLVVNALPAPAQPKVDKLTLSQWDLGQGVFLCGNVEKQLNEFAVWIHVYYDNEALYVLGRFTDKTPLNNPIPINQDSPWEGDALQLHLVSRPRTESERVVDVMGWQHQGGDQRVWVQCGADYKGTAVANALTAGAAQQFRRYPNKTGYVQVLRLPWKLLTTDGRPPGVDETWRFCVQAHFSDAGHQRTTINDVVRENSGPRVTIFRQPEIWGQLQFRGAGAGLKPPPVRLVGGREFAVDLPDGLPVVAWNQFVTQDPPADKVLFKEIDPARKEALRALVRRLGSERSREREQARRELRVDLIEAFEILDEFRNDPDPEIRLSVRELMGNL